MLDGDLAKLYQCSNGTKTLNQAVKRHINRFPKRFMFQLTINNAGSKTFSINKIEDEFVIESILKKIYNS